MKSLLENGSNKSIREAIPAVKGGCGGRTLRSFRAENVSRFVKALLDGEADLGRDLFAAFRE
jgi:hypothetical protein